MYAVYDPHIRRWWLGLAPAGRRVVLLQHAGRDAPALTDRQPVLLRPGPPDITAALTAGCDPSGSASRCPPGPAGVLQIGRELLAERGDVLGVQVDLIIGAIESEPHRLLRRATVSLAGVAALADHLDLLPRRHLYC